MKDQCIVSKGMIIYSLRVRGESTFKHLSVLMVMFFMLLVGNISWAQDYKKIAEELKKKNENAERVKVVIQVSGYENETSRKLFFNEKASILRDGNNYAYSTTTNEMLLNAKYMVVVDKELQQISCTWRDTKSEKTFNSVSRFSMDSILALYGTPEFLGKNESGISRYRFTEEGGTIHSITIFMDEINSVIKKIEYRYADRKYVAITFEIFDFNPQVPANSFDENKFVKIVNGKCTPALAFQNFEMLNTGINK